MDSNFLKQLCSEYKDLSGFISFIKINDNDIDFFYKEDLFDLPSLLFLQTIDNPYFKLQDYYSADVFSKRNSLDIPYDILFSLCSIGNSSQYIISNLKNMDNKLTKELLTDVTENTQFNLFKKQREYFHSLHPNIEKIDDIYGKKYSTFLKANAFLYIYQTDHNDFLQSDKKTYIECYLKDIKNIISSINVKEKLDNRAVKNLKYAIKTIFEDFEDTEFSEQAKKDNLAILLYYNHFNPSSSIQHKIKDILNTGQDVHFEYDEHEKKLLKRIKDKSPDIFALIEKNYLRNNLSSQLENDNIINKKRL